MKRDYFKKNAILNVTIYDIKSEKIYRVMDCTEEEAERQCNGDKDYRVNGYADEQTDEEVKKFIDMVKGGSSPQTFDMVLNSLLND